MVELKKYLQKNKIISIGIPPSDDYIVVEFIVQDPFELIKVVQKSEYYISEIRWWDRANLSTGSSIGYGGPRDPEHYDSFYFAETDINCEFDQETKEEIYRNYLNITFETYVGFDIYPAFDIRRKKEEEDSGRFSVLKKN